jgi:hypothetical protein
MVCSGDGMDMGRKQYQALRKRAFKARRGVTLVGPVKVRSGHLVCPSCDEVTRVHVLVAAAVHGARSRVQGPALVSGLDGLAEPAPSRLALIAPNLVLAGDLRSRSVAFMNHCQHCHSLLSDSDLFDGADSPFLVPEATSSSDTNLSGSDLGVAQATVRIR